MNIEAALRKLTAAVEVLAGHASVGSRSHALVAEARAELQDDPAPDPQKSKPARVEEQKTGEEHS
jgi:hypothetical protein